VNGKQPTTNENPIMDIPIRKVSKKKLNKISHILSTVKEKNFIKISINYCLFLGTTDLLQRINRNVYLF
jgi:hypothetical protein